MFLLQLYFVVFSFKGGMATMGSVEVDQTITAGLYLFFAC